MSDQRDIHSRRRIRRTIPEVTLSQEAAASTSLRLQVGDIANGRYRLLSVLGEGGMGMVFKAEQIYLKKLCALKVLTSGVTSETSWNRFKHEAHAASALDHPNLIKVQDFGLIDEKQPFLVMDLAEGFQLSQIIKARGHLDIEVACALFVQVCKGLEYAHSKGVVHRDMKPDNIIVADADNPEAMLVKIVDFGIAKHNLGDIPSALTKTGELFGTPAYMSPEQCLGQTVDDRSDIYSVGCVLFEALTGTPPFVAGTVLATMWKQQHDNPPTLMEGSLGNEFPPDLERIVAKMLRKDLRTRYSNIGQVAQDLEAVVQNKPTSLGYEAMVEQKENVQAARKSGANLARNMVVFTCFIALGITVGFAIGISRSAKTIPKEQTKIDGVNQIDTTNLKNYVPESLPAAPVSFSYQVPGSAFRLFDFGDIELGTIEGIEPNEQVWVLDHGRMINNQQSPRMVGKLFIDKSFYVHALPELIANSSYFKAFKSEDVRGIRLDSSTVSVDNEFLKNIQHLSRLEALRIKVSNSLNESSLALLNTFDSLNDFALKCSKSQQVDWLAGLKRLKDLKQFELQHAQNSEKIVEALRGSKALKILTLLDCNIDKNLMPTIGSLTTVINLELNGNPIEDKDLESLRGLTSLQVLDVTNCPKLTVGCASVIKTLPIKYLAVSSFGSRHQNDEFRNMLPGMQVDVTTATKRRMDNKDLQLLLGIPTK